MRVSDEMVERATAVAFAQIENGKYVAVHMRKALEAALADVPEPALAQAEDNMGRAFYADVVRLEDRIAELEAQNAELRTEYAEAIRSYDEPVRRIAELEAQLASIGKDMPEMLALCEHKDNRIAELEAQLAKVRDAHERYQRNDIDREEFEGTIAGVAEGM